jgi:hypothetical protein
MTDTKENKVHLTGSCFCRDITYTVSLNSKDDARTSLCHCSCCKKAFGGAFGLTTKIPIESFEYNDKSGKATIHGGDNGSGATVYREFCPKCGSYICEYGVCIFQTGGGGRKDGVIDNA